MREVAKIYLIFDGGRETSRENSLPQSALRASSPLVRGGFFAPFTKPAQKLLRVLVQVHKPRENHGVFIDKYSDEY
jgi:hypothetical protein